MYCIISSLLTFISQLLSQTIANPLKMRGLAVVANLRWYYSPLHKPEQVFCLSQLSIDLTESACYHPDISLNSLSVCVSLYLPLADFVLTHCMLVSLLWKSIQDEYIIL